LGQFSSAELAGCSAEPDRRNLPLFLLPLGSDPGFQFADSCRKLIDSFTKVLGPFQQSPDGLPDAF
jgi:hypothetical protein